MARLRLWSFVLAGTAGAILVATLVLLAWQPRIVGCDLPPVHPKCREQVAQAVFDIVVVLWAIGFIVMVPALALFWKSAKSGPAEGRAAGRAPGRAAGSMGGGAGGMAGNAARGTDARLAAPGQAKAPFDARLDRPKAGDARDARLRR